MLMNAQTASRAPLIEVKGLRHLYHKGSTPTSSFSTVSR